MRGRTALELPGMDRSRMNRMDVWMMIPVFWLLHLTKLNNHEINSHHLSIPGRRYEVMTTALSLELQPMHVAAKTRALLNEKY